ncbi:MAG: aldehyde ferredoxin oxidoreductase family protein [Dehalococcoidales bacterium]
MARGYMGKILKVDLSRNELKDESIDEKLCRDFLGGYGMAARIIFDEQPAGVDPLGQDNILSFLTGPFTGTPAISGTRFTVAGKSPLTGCWGDANSGGNFGAYLKFAGYDAVFFKGIAEKPVYLLIDNGKASLRDAANLWGKDTYETEDALKAELGQDTTVACIGPAGEKLSLIAGVVDSKGHVAARSGLGAVMGSKNLKAIAARGGLKVPLADENAARALRKKYLAQLGGDVDNMRKYGTTFVTVSAVESGDSPVKNWGSAAVRDFPDAKSLGSEVVAARKLKSTACYNCPIGCEAFMRAGMGEYKYEAGSHRPEYETIAMLGSNCLNTNIESIIKANDICNRYGIDTISAGAAIAFTMECYEKGLITQKDTDGIEMTWGNHRSMVAMIEKMAKREGFGDVIADGVQAAARKIGRGAEKYAIHVRGQEVPAHNPAAGFSLATTYITNATPARHTQGSELHHLKGLIPDFDKKSAAAMAGAFKRGSNFQHVLMCSGMCLFVYMALPDVNVIAEFMKAITGRDVTIDELVKTGERIASMRQAFNLREKINLRQFAVPGRILGRPPQSEGPLAGVTVNAEALVADYLKAMDWDLKTATPGKKKLSELGLEDVGSQLGV